MHLIDSNTLRLTWFPGEAPPYAILSHTWGSEEVGFADFGDLSKIETRASFQKIKLTCQQARRDDLGYAWVDTCCINKESSAELSEAINSMFRWYRNATICYAYIEDLADDIVLPIADASLIRGCRWFSRGWTLQELLAPRNIVFYGPGWVNIGRKGELVEVLEQVTGIPRAVLTGETRLDQISVADRMNWAARRQTTREEDIAYCLMGMFDVNMPMMYGEGRKAFLRLQEEIVKQTQDDSLFAWRASDKAASAAPYRGLFASSPSEFASDMSITPFHTSMAGSTTILGNGRVSLSCAVYPDHVLGLKCFRGTDVSSVVGIKVASTGGNQYLRSDPSSLTPKPHIYPAAFDPVIFERFAEKSVAGSLDDVYLRDGLHLAPLPPGMRVMAIHPREYTGWRETMMVPVVYIVGKKFAFELEVDRGLTGADDYYHIGWGEAAPLARVGDIRILLVVWVEQLPGARSYVYYFRLERIGPEDDALSRFDQAPKPTIALDQHELTLGWSVLDARGSLTNVNEQPMFSFSVSLRVREDTKVEVETKSKEKTEADASQAEEEQRRVAARRYAADRPQRICTNFIAVIVAALFFGGILLIIVFLILHSKGYF